MRYVGCLMPGLVLFYVLGCTSEYLIPPDGEYDYRVPVVSGKDPQVFEALMNASLRVTWSPTYRTYHYTHDFTSDDGMRLSHPLPDSTSPTGYRLTADGIVTTKETYSKVGAGLLVARTSVGEELDAAAAVTVAHLVTAPDTLRVYGRDAWGRETDLLERVSVKVGEYLFVTGRDGANLEASVRRLDFNRDLALLTMAIHWRHDTLRGFDARLGRMRDLRWGTFVYVWGYPRGRLRMTGGLVSLDEFQPERFNLDAAIRPGYSGGPVVAVRDGLPNLELVGLCQGAATRKARRLMPDAALSVGSALSLQMLGLVEVGEEEEIEPGLGFAVGIDAVKAFLLESRAELVRKGIDVRNNALLKMWGF